MVETQSTFDEAVLDTSLYNLHSQGAEAVRRRGGASVKFYRMWP